MDRYFACFGLPGSFVLTMLLSALTLVLAAVQRSKVGWLVFAAMAMSSVGDLFMMNFRNLSRTFGDTLVWGAAAFMVAHVLYACAYRSMAKGRGRFFNFGAAVALLIVAGCAVFFARACALRRNFGRFPLAMVYLAVIGGNLTVIFSYAWARLRKNPLALLAAAGAASFFASDFIIGLGLLAKISRYNDLIWWLYPIGQILLITAPPLCGIVDRRQMK